jgi:hypothetical protein
VIVIVMSVSRRAAAARIIAARRDAAPGSAPAPETGLMMTWITIMELL